MENEQVEDGKLPYDFNQELVCEGTVAVDLATLVGALGAYGSDRQLTAGE